MTGHSGTALWLSFFFCSCALAETENGAVLLGRSIYEKGVGRDGREIGATLHGGVVLKGASLACAGCHGTEAQGGGEAFIRAPDIRWLSLSKRYLARRMGAAGVPYDRESFARALRSGVTASGTRLDPVMPHFSLADDEIDSLIAYLSIIDEPAIRGARPSMVLGLLPTQGKNAAADMLGWKMQNCPIKASQSRFAVIDILYFRDPEDAIEQLTKRIQANPNTIVLAPFLIGWEDQYLAASAHWETPTVLPFSFLDPPGENNWHYRFPGLQTQIKALLESAKNAGRSHLKIIRSDDALSLELASFSVEAALQYQLHIEPELENPVPEGIRSAKLWLTPITDNAIARTVKVGDLMLVPALFYGAENGNERVNKFKGVQWRIAYPYTPQRKGNHSWRKPIDVWGDAACEFLAVLSEHPIPLKTLPGSVLHWDQDLYVFPRPNAKEFMERVYIEEIHLR